MSVIYKVNYFNQHKKTHALLLSFLLMAFTSVVSISAGAGPTLSHETAWIEDDDSYVYRINVEWMSEDSMAQVTCGGYECAIGIANDDKLVPIQDPGMSFITGTTMSDLHKLWVKKFGQIHTSTIVDRFNKIPISPRFCLKIRKKNDNYYPGVGNIPGVCTHGNPIGIKCDFDYNIEIDHGEVRSGATSYKDANLTARCSGFVNMRATVTALSRVEHVNSLLSLAGISEQGRIGLYEGVQNLPIKSYLTIAKDASPGTYSLTYIFTFSVF